MKKRLRSIRTTAGFTLLELIVIIAIIGILFAIAAPGWDNLLNRQRVSAAREQTLQLIRQAQAEARTTKASRAVVFEPTPTGGGNPRVATIAYPSTRPGLATLSGQVGARSWKTLGSDSVGAKTIKLTVNTTNNALVFDSNGAVAEQPTVTNPQSIPFIVTLSREGAGAGTRRCIVVDTILGATRLAEGTDCP